MATDMCGVCDDFDAIKDFAIGRGLPPDLEQRVLDNVESVKQDYVDAVIEADRH